MVRTVTGVVERRRAWVPPLVLLGVYTVLALAQFRRVWRDPSGSWIGVVGDPEVQMWFLAHTPAAIGRGDSPFLTSFLNWPDGVNLMWNTTMVLPGAVLGPVTAAFGPVVSWNALLTAGPVLSAWTASFLAHRYTRSWGASFVAGLLFGFSPYMMAHAFGHANLTFLALVPLAALLIDDLLVRQARPALVTGGLLGLVLAAQLLITEEILASMALVGVVALVVLIAWFPGEVRSRVPYALRALGIAGVVALVVTAWPLWTQFRGAGRITHGTIQPKGTYVTDLVELVRPTGLQQLAPDWASEAAHRFSPIGLEWNGYVGIPLVALTLWIVWRSRRLAVVRVFGTIAGVLTVLSLGPELVVDGRRSGIPMPFAVVEALPVFGHLLANRLMAYVFLCLAMLVAVFLAEHERARSRWRAVGAYGVVALALVFLFPLQPHPDSTVRVPAFFEPGGEVSRIPDGSVALVAPFTTGPGDVDPMLWQAVSGMHFRMPSGYFVGAAPDGGPRYGPPASTVQETMAALGRGEDVPVTPQLVADVRSDLERWDVDTVIVGPMREGRAATLALFAEVLGTEADRSGGVAIWWDLSG